MKVVRGTKQSQSKNACKNFDGNKRIIKFVLQRYNKIFNDKLNLYRILKFSTLTFENILGLNNKHHSIIHVELNGIRDRRSRSWCVWNYSTLQVLFWYLFSFQKLVSYWEASWQLSSLIIHWCNTKYFETQHLSFGESAENLYPNMVVIYNQDGMHPKHKTWFAYYFVVS